MDTTFGGGTNQDDVLEVASNLRGLPATSSRRPHGDQKVHSSSAGPVSTMSYCPRAFPGLSRSTHTVECGRGCLAGALQANPSLLARRPALIGHEKCLMKP